MEALRARAGRHAPAAILVLVMLAFFREPLFGDAYFFFRDAFRIYFPFRLFMVAELAAGRMPLWYPFETGGIAFFGQLVPGVLYPLNLVYLLAPFRVAYQLNFILPFLLASGATYAWARHRGIGRAGALAAGLVYAYSGSLVSQSNLIFLLGNATVPLALLLFDRCLEKPGAGRLLVASIGFVLILFSGEPQSLIVAGIFAAILALHASTPRDAGRRIGLLGLTTLGAILLGAVQLLPSAETFLQASRLVEINHSKWSFPPLRIVEFLVPDILRENESIFTVPAYSDFNGYPWAPRVYLGPVAFALAIVGALRRDRQVLPLATAAVVALWLSLGPDYGLQTLFAKVVPAWSGFRFPEKLIPYFALPTAMLCGYGLEQVVQERRRWVLLVVAAVCLAMSGAFLLASAPERAETLTRFFRGVTTGSLVAAALVAAAALAAFLPVSRAIRAAALAALAVVPVLYFNHDAPKYETARDFFFIPWSVQQLEAASPERKFPIRIYSHEDFGLYALQPTVGDTIRGSGIQARRALLSNFNSVFGIENMATYQPGAPYRTIRSIEKVPIEERLTRMLPIFAVEYLVVDDPTMRVPEVRWELYSQDPASKQRIFRSTQRLERTYVARSVTKTENVDQAASMLSYSRFPAADVVLVEADVAPEEHEIRDRGTATILAWQPQRVAIEAKMTDHGYLVLNDAWAPGWKVDVDGEPAQLVIANGFVRSVKLPPGEHLVEFYYAPLSFTVGAWISVLALAGWILLILVRRRHAPPAAAPAPAA